MPSPTTFFLTPPPLSLRSRFNAQPSSTPTQRRPAPMMLSPVTTAAGLITASTTSAAAFYFLRPKLFKDKKEPAATAPSTSEVPPSPPPRNIAVLGLSQPNAPFKEEDSAGTLLPSPAPPTSSVPQLYMDSINPALFDFRDEMSITQDRLASEFSTSASLLSDLDTVKSVLVIDGERDIVWASGTRISGNVGVPNMSKLVKEAGDVYVMPSKGEWIFMGEQVKEVAVVKMDNGMVVVGGESEGFFGNMERRLSVAVANKLSRVLEIGKSLRSV